MRSHFMVAILLFFFFFCQWAVDKSYILVSIRLRFGSFNMSLCISFLFFSRVENPDPEALFYQVSKYFVHEMSSDLQPNIKIMEKLISVLNRWTQFIKWINNKYLNRSRAAATAFVKTSIYVFLFLYFGLFVEALAKKKKKYILV